MAQRSSKKKFSSNDTNGFYHFQRLCKDIDAVAARTAKTKIISEFVKDYDGDLVILARLLLPKVQQRIYHISDKKLFKLFGRVFNVDGSEIEESYQKGKHAGDISNVIRGFYIKNGRPKSRSRYSLEGVDKILNDLADTQREDVQSAIFQDMVKTCTPEDIKWFIRFIKHDLLLNVGPQGVLEGFDPNAYKAFQVNSDLSRVLGQVRSKKGVQLGGVDLMTPIKPMLAKACKSYEEAMKKCKSGLIFGEIKYDGERIQIHWNGTTCTFYSRSLKSVAAHKVAYIEGMLPNACQKGSSLILDAEILLLDTVSGNPLPFGSLGKHKKEEFKDASVCLFVFDILYYNGKSLLQNPIIERRKLMEEHLTEIPNQFLFSELNRITDRDDLETLMDDVMSKGLEGLVLKDSMGIYAPGKRHWLKMKRDYLAGGQMADSADLVVLGATYGTTRHGGLYSTFLVGVLDKESKKFKTVCRAHNGLSDDDIKRFTKTLKMIQVNKDPSKFPKWLVCKKVVAPDMVVANPKNSVVFEVTGAEFTYSKRHTSAIDASDRGISIRFPRVTRIRTDKDYKTATSLRELVTLAKTSAPMSSINSKKLGPGGKKPASKPKPTKAMPVGRQDPSGNKKRKPRREVPESRQLSPSPPSSPKRQRKGKRLCKFGRKCYRQNPDHFRRYLHPHLDADGDEIVGSFVTDAKSFDGKRKRKRISSNKPRNKKKQKDDEQIDREFFGSPSDDEDMEFHFSDAGDGDAKMPSVPSSASSSSKPRGPPGGASSSSSSSSKRATAVRGLVDTGGDSSDSDGDPKEKEKRKTLMFDYGPDLEKGDQHLQEQHDAQVREAYDERKKTDGEAQKIEGDNIADAKSRFEAAEAVAKEVETAAVAKAKKVKDDTVSKAKTEMEKMTSLAQEKRKESQGENEKDESDKLSELSRRLTESTKTLEKAKALQKKQRTMYLKFHSPTKSTLSSKEEAKDEPSAIERQFSLSGDERDEEDSSTEIDSDNASDYDADQEEKELELLSSFSQGLISPPITPDSKRTKTAETATKEAEGSSGSDTDVA